MIDEVHDISSVIDRNNLFALINNTNDLMWSVDRNYKLITSNNAFDEMVKYMSGNIIIKGGDVLAIGFTQPQLARYRKLYDRAFAGEIFTVTEYGELPVVYWSELSFHPIRNGDEVVGTACYAHDITKNKLAQEKIINTQRLYEFISQINQAITHITDEKTLFHKACDIAVSNGKFDLSWIGTPDVANKRMNVIAYNSSASSSDIKALENLKYDEDGPTAIVMRNGEYYVNNDFGNKPAIISSKIFVEQRGYKSLIVLPIKKSGNTIATYGMLSTHANLFDEQEIRLLKESASDISFALDVFEKEKHRKEMEQETAHSKLRLNQAQAIAHLGSWELDFSSGTGKWSKEACRIYGLSLEDNIHSYQSWMAYIHPDDLDYVLRVTKEGETKLSSSAFQHRILLANGEIKHIYSEAHFDFNKDGKPIGLYGIAQDVTKSTQLENERTKIVAEILQRNNDLEQFSYIVSHNLRAPVANILGLVDILQTIGIDKEEEKIITGFLATAAKNLDNVIFDISHILDLKHDVNKQKEHLIFDELLSEVKLSINSMLNAEQVNIVYDFSEAPGIFTVKSYLYSIFINLISNSVKYRRPGISPIINICSRIINNKIQLSFKDNGLGIDIAKNGDEIFGLYKRFHYHVEGKGMGLYMVKSQVELLGGNITVSSEIDKGTEFCIDFE